MAEVKELPATSKVGDKCPHCDGQLRLKRMPPRVYLECDANPLHYRHATEAEKASLQKGKS